MQVAPESWNQKCGRCGGSVGRFDGTVFLGQPGDDVLTTCKACTAAEKAERQRLFDERVIGAIRRGKVLTRRQPEEA